MSTTIDSKVVEAKFDNKQFESGVSTTLSSLDKLKAALHLDHASKGLEEVSRTASKMNLGALGDAAEDVGKKFSAMSVAGITAIATLTNKVVNAGLNIAKSFSIAPITQGFGEYETKIGSIQTILANTSRFGTKLPEVTKNLNELNTYADKTIYSFGDMTKNIGLFTNAGIRVGDATSMIKGFSNAAAASGTTAEGAAGAAYQLSQALSAGQIRLMDWRSLTNVGMGNKNMQMGLIDIANAMGTLKKSGTDAKTVQGNFNASLEKGWLTADVMSKYLKIMAGDMDVAKMKSLGLSDAQIKTFTEQQKTAENAATKVRTFTQLVGTIKEAVGSGWAQTFELLLGNFDEASVLFTNINNAVGKFVEHSTDARYKIIHDWRMLHGRGILIKDIGEAFKGLGQIVKAISGAFREIFPAKTGKDLLALTEGFGNFIKRLKMGEETANNLKRVFAGVFAVFDIAKQVISGVAHAIGDLFAAFAPKGAGGSLLAHGAAIGDIIVYYDKLLKSSNGVEDFLNNLEGYFAKPMAMINRFRDALDRLADSIDLSVFDKMGGASDRLTQRLSPLDKIIQGIGNVFKALGPVLSKVGDALGNALSAIGDHIKSAFNAENFSHVLDLVNTLLLGGLFVVIKKFTSGSKKELGGGFLNTIKTTFSTITDTLSAMQTKLKAQALLAIAGSLAILVGAIALLAMIDPGDIAKSLGALYIGMKMLTGALEGLTESIGPLQSMKLPFIAAGLIGLGIGLNLLATAVKIMATMDMGDMLRGLTGLAIGLTIIQKTMERMPKNMVAQSAALLILAAALNGIAVAIKVFATISWDELGHGLAGMGSALLVIAAGMRAMPKGMIAQAVALNLMATAIAGIGLALKLLGTISWDAMAHGLTALAGSLVIIAVAMRLMPQNMLMQSVALNAVATAMVVLGTALKLMATMSWGEIAKGLVTLAGAMVILAVGLNAMNGTLAGSAALAVAAAAIMLLTPALVTMGTLDWTTILKSLTMLAGVFTVLGIAGLVLTPLVPSILGLSVSLLVLGAGMALLGGGLLAVAGAFAIVVATGTAGIQMLQGILMTVIKSIPIALKAVAEGLIIAVKTIGVAAPGLVKAFAAIIAAWLDSLILNIPKFGKLLSTIMVTILNVVIATAPKMGQAFLAVVMTALHVLETAVPRMAQAGLRMLLGVLNAINDNISKIIPVTVSIIVKFINGIAAGLPKIIDAGVKMIISFINGLSQAIDAHSAEMGEAGGRLAVAIVKGMAKGIEAGGGVIADAAKDLAKHALDSAKSFLGIKSPSKEFEKIGNYVNEGFVQGLTGNRDQVTAAFDHIVDQIKTAREKATQDISKFNSTITKLNGELLGDDKAIAKQRQVLSDAEAKQRAARITAHTTHAKQSAEARQNAAAQEAAQQQRDAQAQKAFDAAKAKSIQDAKDKLEKLTEARNKDAVAIRAAKAALNDAYLAQQLATDAYNTLTVGYKDQVTQLQNLADAHEELKTKIEEADKAVQDAIKTRDDYKKSITDAFNALPDINKDTTLADYVSGLQSKKATVEEFSSALEQLRNYGLSDEMYQEFLKKGVDSLPFVEEVLKGGQESVTLLNENAKGLATAAEALGTMASNAMYQAGVDTAQGLLDGLKSQEAALEAEMARIAAILAQKAKEELKIKSPSRVFAEIGKYTVQGLAEGMGAYSSVVSDAATATGKEAVRALTASLNGLSNGLDLGLELNPTITPILDLSAVQKEAKLLNPLLSNQKIEVGASFTKAKEVSNQYLDNVQASSDNVSQPSTEPAPSLTFIQNNTSPKALSSADIYRRTKSQISQAKGVLTSANETGSS